MTTSHAMKRAQQRRIPLVVDQWLDEFGEEQYDGRGGMKVYFSGHSKERMKRKFGTQFVEYNSKWLRAYRVESSHDGRPMTCGWLTRRVKHP